MPSTASNSANVTGKTHRWRFFLIPLVAVVSAAVIAGTVLVKDNGSTPSRQDDAVGDSQPRAATAAPPLPARQSGDGLTTDLAPAPFSERSLLAEQVSLWMSRAFAVRPNVVQAARTQVAAAADSGQPQMMACGRIRVTGR